VRRAKLYYLRDRTGKSARIAEKIKKKIGIDIETKIQQVTEENVMPVTDDKSTETLKEEAKVEVSKAEAKPFPTETPKKKAPKKEAKIEGKKQEQQKENLEQKK
jgi:large subunit ribosomal protein L19